VQLLGLQIAAHQGLDAVGRAAWEVGDVFELGEEVDGVGVGFGGFGWFLGGFGGLEVFFRGVFGCSFEVLLGDFFRCSFEVLF
jgi:hypothetical protein